MSKNDKNDENKHDSNDRDTGTDTDTNADMSELLARINPLLNGIVGRQDCRVEFQSARSLSNLNDSNNLWRPNDLWRLNDTDRKSDGALTLIQSRTGDCCGLPVHSANGTFVGLVVIHGWSGENDMKSPQLLHAAELLALIVESRMRLAEQRDLVRATEEHLLRTKAEQESRNVVPLRKSHERRQSERIKQPEQRPLHAPMPAHEHTASPPSQLTLIPLLIETGDGFSLHRIAVEIHSLARRWAFLSADDALIDIFTSKEALQQLGAITLFIPDLARLSTNQQLKLAEYLATQPSAEAPHVVAGVTEPLRSLVESRRVMPHLVSLFHHVRPDELSATEESTEGSHKSLQLFFMRPPIHH